MRTAKRCKNKVSGKVVIAVMFGGSSTDIATLTRWMEVGGVYKSSGITTCDIREFEFTDPEYGLQVANMGDYIMYDGKGYFVAKSEWFDSCWEKLCG